MDSRNYFIFIILLGVILAQEDDDNDGKYHPDAIPVWEHERQDYTFSYGVKDLNTGDVKNQWEKKIGDTIHGHYTVLEPDGSLRIVHYTADEKNGFNAVVKHEGPSYHPVTIAAGHTQPPVRTTTRQHLQAPAKTAPLEPFTFEDPPSVRIEPESDMEHIDAFLYIPSLHRDVGDTKVTHYELVADDKYQHFLNYDGPGRGKTPHKSRKPVDASVQTNYKPKSGEHSSAIGYDLLTPVTVDLSPTDFDSYKRGGAAFNEPNFETGFRPLPKAKPEAGRFPNTFTTNKKPVTTPGLKAYASDASYHGPHLRGPVIFPKRMDKEKLIQFASGNSKKGTLKYTKQVAYIPDDY